MEMEKENEIILEIFTLIVESGNVDINVDYRRNNVLYIYSQKVFEFLVSADLYPALDSEQKIKNLNRLKTKLENYLKNN